jgi:octaprenyl-diphosphate synthase
MAFQIVDDLLDFTASEEVLGKPVGSDLREGKVTLPLIYLLDRCTPEEHSKLAKVMEERAFLTVPWQELLDLLRRYETPDRVKDLANLYAHRARKCLEGCPDSPYKHALAALPDFVVNRKN